MPIKKPAEEPAGWYVSQYCANQWAKWTHRRNPPYPNAVGICLGCKREGILGWDLIHRGLIRRTNLFCGGCFKGGGGGTKEVPKDRKRVAPKRGVPGLRTKHVGPRR